MKPISFNAGWSVGEGPGPASFMRMENMENPECRPVTLPHDAMAEKERSAGTGGGAQKSFFPNGSFHYTKQWTLPPEWAGKQVYLEFEGAYANARICINEDYAGQCPNGYADFLVACHDHLYPDRENTILVTVRTGDDSRWYSGAGLYRNVNLYVCGPLHIAYNGVKLTTESANEKAAAVAAEITLVNDDPVRHLVQVVTEFRDREGALAALDVRKHHIAANTTESIRPRIYIKDPKLWSPDEPNLYSVHVRIEEAGAVVDEALVETFGIRTLSLDNIQGLCINGKPVKLYGGCLHHDNGIIGAAAIERAEERKIQLLKSVGYNAVRSAHNPASKAMLRACDRCGVVVMDELTDMWSLPKTAEDYSTFFAYRWEEDIRAMVDKDYNHPSVVFYSVGNEIPESGRIYGAQTYRKLIRRVREADGTRYVTAGLNSMFAAFDVIARHLEEQKKNASGEINGTMMEAGGLVKSLSSHPQVMEITRESYDSMDVCGYNYAADRYLTDAEQYTNRVAIGCETCPKDLAKHWKLMEEHPHIIGDFCWTAWDYLGEVGIGRDQFRNLRDPGIRGSYPWVTACVGDFDITGVRNAIGYYREIVVGHRTQPYIAVQDPARYALEPRLVMWTWTGREPSWNWEGFAGSPIRVEVYGRGDVAELFINGEPVGKRSIPQESEGEDVLAYRTVFDVSYQPGRVEARIYKDDVCTGQYTLETAGEPVHLRACADRTELRADETDLAYIDIRLEDLQGRVHPGAEKRVSVAVEGAGRLLALGSGNHVTQERYTDGTHTTFRGRAMAVVRPVGAGAIKVRVCAEGFQPVDILLQAN